MGKTRIRIVKRDGCAKWKKALMYLIAIIVALGIGAILLSSLDVNPFQYYEKMFTMGMVDKDVYKRQLLTETRHLSITGYHATAIKELLFHKYGMITETAPASFSLHELALPKVVNTSKGDIPIEIAEALLIIATGAYPRKDIRYLRQLSKTCLLYTSLRLYLLS